MRGVCAGAAGSTTGRDLLGFRIGRTVHHLGIMLDRGEFIHVLDHVGTVVSQLNDPTYSGRLARVWVPVELEGSKIGQTRE